MRRSPPRKRRPSASLESVSVRSHTQMPFRLFNVTSRRRRASTEKATSSSAFVCLNCERSAANAAVLQSHTSHRFFNRVHEERLLALLLLVDAFRDGSARERRRISRLYLTSTR